VDGKPYYSARETGALIDETQIEAGKQKHAADQQKTAVDHDQEGCYSSKHTANGVWDGRPVGRIPVAGMTTDWPRGTAIDRNYDLRMRLQAARINSEDLERAVGIVDKHPEFLDLLWLLRSGLV
jgi:hypothetical protein